MLTGSAAAFEGPVNYAYGFSLSKMTTHALALQMATRTELPENATVITILPQIIESEMNAAIEGYGEDAEDQAPPEKIASLVSAWADNENRPMNGSFAKLNY